MTEHNQPTPEQLAEDRTPEQKGRAVVLLFGINKRHYTDQDEFMASLIAQAITQATEPLQRRIEAKDRLIAAQFGKLEDYAKAIVQLESEKAALVQAIQPFVNTFSVDGRVEGYLTLSTDHKHFKVLKRAYDRTSQSAQQRDARLREAAIEEFSKIIDEHSSNGNMPWELQHILTEALSQLKGGE